MSRRCDVGGVGLRRSSCRQIVEYSVEMSRAIRAPPRRMAALHGTKRGERLMAAPDMQAVCDDVLCEISQVSTEFYPNSVDTRLILN